MELWNAGMMRRQAVLYAATLSLLLGRPCEAG